MVEKKPSKPSVETILELYDDVEKKYSESGIRRAWEIDDNMYELDFMEKLMLPEEFKEEGIVLPTARDLVDTSCDNTDVFNPRVYVNRKGTTEKAKDEQELLRKFGLGVLYRNNMETTLSPLQTARKHFWLYGVCVLKTVWDADRYMDKPDREENESDEDYNYRVDVWRADQHNSLPIRILAVHPRNVMFDPYKEGGTFVFERKEELCYNVRNKFTKWSNPKKRKDSDRIEHISFWTAHYRCELYDREPVLKGRVVEHDYGFLPYIQIDTGLGNITADNDLTKRYVGVLRYVKGLLISESRDYSIGDVILKRTAYPWGYITGPGAETITDIKQKFGEYNVLPDGVELHDITPQMPPKDLLTWLSVAANYLSAHAAPPAVRGMGEEGVRSGADRRLIIAQASTRYQYSNQAFKHGVAKALSNCAKILKNVIPGTVAVWARTPADEFDFEIDKEKIHEPFTFYVEFAPVSEEDEYRRHDDLERLVKAGLVTVNWARRQMSNIDPDDMELQEEIERIKNSPMMQQMIEQYASSKLLQELIKRSQADAIDNPPPLVPNMAGAEGMAGQQEPGRRMAAPIPENAPPGSAQEMQNQMKQNRSQTSMNQQGVGGGGNRR